MKKLTTKDCVSFWLPNQSVAGMYILEFCLWTNTATYWDQLSPNFGVTMFISNGHTQKFI